MGRSGSATRRRTASSRSQSGPSRSGPRLPGDPRLLARADQLDHAQLVPDGLPLLVGQQQPDPVAVAQPLGRGPDPQLPSIFRWVCTVRPLLGPGQQVLTARDGFGHDIAGQVGGGQPGNAEVAAGQHPSRQRLVQAAGSLPDNVSLGMTPVCVRSKLVR